MEKATVYSPEQTVSLIADYKAGKAVGDIAEAMGKTVQSVIAKLSREGVYVKAAKVATPRVTKAQLISVIAVKYGVSDESLESLDKATKETLAILAGVEI